MIMSRTVLKYDLIMQMSNGKITSSSFPGVAVKSTNFSQT
jgi:hypothetical protein